MKKRNITITLLLTTVLIIVVYTYKLRNILQDVGKVEQITLYNIDSKE